MNYQRLACWGDSQTFGARTYGCYPLYLVEHLNDASRYTWSALNLSSNGHTARDLWFRLTMDVTTLKDIYRACVLIGANDVSAATPITLFAQYFQQSLDALKIAGFRVLHCGEIPPIFADGHAFFSVENAKALQDYNEVIRDVVNKTDGAFLVQYPELGPADYVDPVHFNELGNQKVAAAFAASILNG